MDLKPTQNRMLCLIVLYNDFKTKVLFYKWLKSIKLTFYINNKIINGRNHDSNRMNRYVSMLSMEIRF